MHTDPDYDSFLADDFALGVARSCQVHAGIAWNCHCKSFSWSRSQLTRWDKHKFLKASALRLITVAISTLLHSLSFVPMQCSLA